MGYVMYKEGTIARRSGDPTDPGADEWATPPSRVFHRGHLVDAATLADRPVPLAAWRPILGFPGYEMSSLRQVRSWNRRKCDRTPRDEFEPRVMTIWRNAAGVGMVTLKHENGRTGGRRVDRLFAATFPEAAGIEAEHGNNGDTEAA